MPEGRDAAAGGNARALHPGRLPVSSRRSLSNRKSFHWRPKATAVKQHASRSESHKPALVARWNPPVEQRI
ncbi:MAG: hypothetical protein LBQ54_06500 [Planctomycetaceae bacterium]|nr:hypothetical protein [Planctomycetaceae bacterium]